MKSIQISKVHYEMLVKVFKKTKRKAEADIEEAIKVAFYRKK